VWPILLLGGLLFMLKNNAGVALDSDDEFSKYDSFFRKYGKTYKVPWRWIKAIAIVESSLGNARSVKHGLENPGDIDGSKSGDSLSWGIMQTTLSTARWLEGQQIMVPYLNDAENSIRLGAKYLQYLIGQFGYDAEKVSRGYNGGPTYYKRPIAAANTLVYFGKFKIALATIMSKQPGNEMEY
jgi:soluble lytic murein transglycosylase-like protein